MSKTEISKPSELKEDHDIEKSLRPQSFSEFIGQKKIVNNMKLYITAALGRDEPLDHVLLFGSPGLGKTTIANIIAKELGVNISMTSGPALEKAGDLAGILTKLGEKDVLFIDEIHRLNATIEEYLYSAMEDYQIDIIIDKGPNARSVQLKLSGFTLVGATTRAGLLTSPLRDRFGVVERLDYYTTEELRDVIIRSARILDIEIDDDATWEIAKRSRGTPRIANRLLRRIRDFAQVEAQGVITKDVSENALEKLEVDEIGLDDMDKKIILTIIGKFSGGPVGLSSLAVAVGEERNTIEEVYEPFL
ncbi:MAG: Holliday junction branch migration DNA helicase RuvB, partial [Candidatus Marinimicrobia bacterium]|nr:Holliday junction branch migration DNA helicase RuvB [Candidatus Neomarinimicrobiota bacterium]